MTTPPKLDHSFPTDTVTALRAATVALGHFDTISREFIKLRLAEQSEQIEEIHATNLFEMLWLAAQDAYDVGLNAIEKLEKTWRVDIGVRKNEGPRVFEEAYESHRGGRPYAKTQEIA